MISTPSDGPYTQDSQSHPNKRLQQTSLSGFCKQQRLLNSHDFKNVFSDPPFRASHQHCLILAKPNQLPYDRLGLIIAKKHIKLAVHRNRIKRLIRESFRLQSSNPCGIDAIVLARKGLGELDNQTVTKIVNQQWLRIRKKTQAK